MKSIKWQYFLMGMLTMALVLIAVPNVLGFFGIRLQFSKTTVGDKVNVLERYIDKYFWKNINDDELEDYALKGLVYGLGDKYSTYYTEAEYQEVTADLNGVYSGIGVVLKQISADGGIIINEVYEGSPAEKAGLKVGDVFVKVNGKDAKKSKIPEMAKELKGAAGTAVELVVERAGKEVTCKVVKEELKLKSIKSKVLEDGVGYISILEFDHETAKQFKAAMERMRKSDIKEVVFDVRDNGGGTLTTVIEMLDELLPGGELLTVKNKEKTLEEHNSTNENHFDKPCAVLINGHSASAAEVFAGVMQDRGAAVLVGTKSFGKGIVQTIFSLKNVLGGGAIKLTTAEYFLPSGRSIHGKGLTPDVNVKAVDDPAIDEQLQAAVKALKKD